MESVANLYEVVVSVLKNPASQSRTVLGEAFIADLMIRATKPKVLNIQNIEGIPTFVGYPDGDYINQVLFQQAFCVDQLGI